MQAVSNGTEREATTLPPSASAVLGFDRKETGRRNDALIELDHVTKRFLTPRGDAFTAIRDVNLIVEPGQFCAIVGPTGCGKSTTLTLVSGLDRPSAGEVRVGGKIVDGIARGVSFVFQADALLPWKTVLGNVAMGPIFRGVRKREAEKRARE